MDPSERLTYTIARVAAEISHRGASAVAALGLDTRALLVLIALWSKQPLTQRELSERLGIDRTTVVQVIDRLEADGRVARRRNPEDRRAYDVTITPGGRKVLARHGPLERARLKLVATKTRSFSKFVKLTYEPEY